MKFLALLLIAAPALAAEPPFYRELAVQHAPVIFQETGGTPIADALTRVDFDGDLDGSNNWERATAFPALGYVYYSVVETQTHWFITYAFFHTRDYSRVCIPVVCHENDLEGAILTVKKTPHRSRFGELLLLETLAHFGNPSAFNPATELDPFTKEQRVGIFIERMGHGVHPLTPKNRPDPKHTLLYAYAGRAENPGGASQGIIGYDLLSIQTELWERGDLVGENGLWSSAFRYRGKRFSWPSIPFEFNGDNFRRISRPQPPWAWGSPGGFATGEWFLDPALVVARHKEMDPMTFSLEYLYHPFMP